MKLVDPRILTINGGSSSIKFTLFEAGDSLRSILEGAIERIGRPEASLLVKGIDQADMFSRSVVAPNHGEAVNALMDWLEGRAKGETLTAVGHRLVHGGARFSQPLRITAEVFTELRRLSPFAPDHLPEEPCGCGSRYPYGRRTSHCRAGLQHARPFPQKGALIHDEQRPPP